MELKLEATGCKILDVTEGISELAGVVRDPLYLTLEGQTHLGQKFSVKMECIAVDLELTAGIRDLGDGSSILYV